MSLDDTTTPLAIAHVLYYYLLLEPGGTRPKQAVDQRVFFVKIWEIPECKVSNN